MRKSRNVECRAGRGRKGRSTKLGCGLDDARAEQMAGESRHSTAEDGRESEHKVVKNGAGRVEGAEEADVGRSKRRGDGMGGAGGGRRSTRRTEMLR